MEVNCAQHRRNLLDVLHDGLHLWLRLRVRAAVALPALVA